jgi:hypothetical protein
LNVSEAIQHVPEQNAEVEDLIELYSQNATRQCSHTSLPSAAAYQLLLHAIGGFRVLRLVYKAVLEFSVTNTENRY